ncbi:MAG: hypothetical protein K0S07_371 [Chlamydiales bacterium]|jgi:predicted negative regulator of RcsB-dependent stress response|nr:hypothetical protein [Chlamydiales bacterium]
MDEPWQLWLFIIVGIGTTLFRKYQEAAKPKAESAEKAAESYQDFLKKWQEGSLPSPSPLARETVKETISQTFAKVEPKMEMAKKERPAPILKDAWQPMPQSSSSSQTLDMSYQQSLKDVALAAEQAYEIRTHSTVSRARSILDELDQRQKMIVYQEIIAPPLSIRNYDL